MFFYNFISSKEMTAHTKEKEEKKKLRAEKSLREKGKGIISYLIYTSNYFMLNRYTVGPYWYLNDYQIILILFQRTFSSCRFAALNEDFF